MQIVTEHITLKNEDVILTNQRAIYWEREEALILSDIHIGKTAHFRRHGIPIPDGILQKDLNRLKELILHFNAKELFIVGDLFHAETNSDMATFKQWLTQFEDLNLVLIKGNHDTQSLRLMDDLGIVVMAQLEIEPFIFLHEPMDNTLNLFTISGHTHPGVLIKGRGKQKLKLPCYQVTVNQLILPAFSLFTGLNTRNIPKDASCYAFTDTSIFKL
ncbi:ligase-associated DNA damage response endonuclease PdeM [Winogradskyella alexanderae]|uniref:Ligase-associated DNA damage response endonuclease PdeM n=1 Tax=Winogradskyella alexanderae TaxID=2877123 RepID=A0ABS7XRG4_9FLAO|nr:ligase-associated DNA damage response endonuclease PdeM [Winogradskyella alexanderae]MCA0132620.1 ligase-associated DNA damage response endonuclease PdeM [Winogradskyella alexanderae]